MPLIKHFNILVRINLWKTFYFNFHYFPFRTAVRMPFLVFNRTKLYRVGGGIIIDAPVTMGMVKLGAHGLGTQDFSSRTIWDVSGTLLVKGKAFIGQGTRINVGGQGKLIIGANFCITGDSQILCQECITFGSRCLLSWDILIMDTDWHYIFNDNDKLINPPKPITIGNHVWIGCRNTILKGVSIEDGVIISANSTITRSVSEKNCIIGGHGKTTEIIKRDVNWTYTLQEKLNLQRI